MFANIKIILVETSHPGNIGAVARAMKTMGLMELVLVNPKYFPHESAVAMAAGAEDVLQNARVCSSLAAAISDCELVLGATARARDLAWPMLHPKELTTTITGKRTALVFGREKSGLTNDELWLCHAGINIPTSPVYKSLNLAQAVQIITYELWNSQATNVQTCAEPSVTAKSLEQFYQHLEDILITVEFMNADEPKRLMPKIRRLFNRADIKQSEMNILRGILTQIDKHLARG